MDSDATKARPSVFEYAGGSDAFLALAYALHERCLEDPVLNHPFSHPSHPRHLERLAGYLGEVFGGPRTYSKFDGGHSAMLGIHAGTGADEDMAARFVVCFDRAVDDARLPTDREFRKVLHDYISWAAGEVNAISPLGSVVPEDLAFPHWSWEGLEG